MRDEFHIINHVTVSWVDLHLDLLALKLAVIIMNKYLHDLLFCGHMCL